MSPRAALIITLSTLLLAGMIVLDVRSPAIAAPLAGLAALVLGCLLVYPGLHLERRYQQWLVALLVVVTQLLAFRLVAEAVFVLLGTLTASIILLFILCPVLLVWVLAAGGVEDAPEEDDADDEGWGRDDDDDPDQPDPTGPDDTDRLLWDLIERTRVRT